MGLPPSEAAVPSRSRVRARRRWWVHAALIGTAAVSLVVEPMLTLHIALGLAFVAFVAVHLVQRRRVSAALAARLRSVSALPTPASRLALADALLTALTLAMLGSGLWDWGSGHPTRIRWHAITGVLLAGFLLVHTVRRRARLRSSRVR
ncbi:MAG: hypothetical protein ACXVGE_08125 [Blastococcus sp.]